MQRRSRWVAVVACVALVAVAACDTKGPAPTVESIQAETGTFAIASTSVAAGNGFGGGTIYAPTDTAHGKYGAVAIVPGYQDSANAFAWYGPRIATQGFVVIIIDSIGLEDGPGARGNQLLAALSYLSTQSSVAAEVDPNRLAVMGHSMGGGGALDAAKAQPSLRATIALAPWEFFGATYGTNTSPTLVVGCEDDVTAPPANFARTFYNGLTAKKAYVEIAGGDHACPRTPNTTVAALVISWLKRFVDTDTRYTPFLCPTPTGPTISRSESSCPY